MDAAKAADTIVFAYSLEHGVDVYGEYIFSTLFGHGNEVLLLIASCTGLDVVIAETLGNGLKLIGVNFAHDFWQSLRFTTCLSSGIPSCLHAVTGIKSLPAKKQSEAKKVLQRIVEKRFPSGNAKVFSLDTPQDSLLLLRQANEQKRKIPALRMHRSYLIAENVAFQDGGNGRRESTLGFHPFF